MRKIYLLSLLIILLPYSLLAHPGHGDTGGYSIIHYFIEPIHTITTVSILMAAVFYYRWQKKKSKV